MFEFNGKEISDNHKEDLIYLRNYLNKEIEFRDLIIDLLTEESFNFFIQRLDLDIEIQRFPYLDVNVNVPWPLI